MSHYPQYGVTRLCRVLRVSRGGFYGWRDQRDRPGVRKQRRLQLTEQIRQAHRHSRGTYGSPRLTVELKASGVSVCENTVAKYMRQIGLRSRVRRRFMPRTTDSD